VISDDDLFEIKPPEPNASATTVQVHQGIPIPKAARVKIFPPDDWEVFVEEWATSLKSTYKKVRRFGGSGDLGVDVAGFYFDQGFEGKWDNYQCKRYDHPLRPSDIWVEIGKIIYYAHQGEYIAPHRHYFVCSQGVGTKLEKLLNKPTELKEQAAENWGQHCKKGITSTTDVVLEGDLLDFFNAFDFTIFSSKSHVELINAHSKTGYHAVRFGGGLPYRPDPETPPDSPTSNESRYIRQLLNAYGSHLSQDLENIISLDKHDMLKRDYLRQRERFYHAESLRNFARDTVPDGTFNDLQNEVFHGIVDIAEGIHSNGFERMKASVAQASQVAMTANPLASVTKAQDRQGICHQLANVDRVIWVPEDE